VQTPLGDLLFPTDLLISVLGVDIYGHLYLCLWCTRPRPRRALPLALKTLSPEYIVIKHISARDDITRSCTATDNDHLTLTVTGR